MTQRLAFSYRSETSDRNVGLGSSHDAPYTCPEDVSVNTNAVRVSSLKQTGELLMESTGLSERM
jgi:hypothetical protein